MPQRKPVLLVLAFVAAACQAPTSGTPAASATSLRPTREATASLIPSPPATATETPAPALRDFVENFDGSLPYWDFLQVESGQAAIRPNAEGGSLVIDLPAQNQWIYELYTGHEYADVRVDARIEFRGDGGEQRAAGIVCRYGNDSGWYEFNIYADQTYTILFGQWLTTGVARYTPIVRAQSELIQAAENEIGLLCEGDVLTPFVNGTQLRRREEKAFGLTSGKIGISAASFEDVPASVAYDWVKVSEP